jgi:hypothetical protein
MVNPHTSPQPFERPGDVAPFLPLYAEHPTDDQYARMAEIASYLPRDPTDNMGRAQNIYAELVAPSAEGANWYVAMSGVCHDMSRNPGATETMREVSKEILDFRLDKVGQPTHEIPPAEDTFNIASYLQGHPPRPELVPVATKINECFGKIQFYTNKVDPLGFDTSNDEYLRGKCREQLKIIDEVLDNHPELSTLAQHHIAVTVQSAHLSQQAFDKAVRKESKTGTNALDTFAAAAQERLALDIPGYERWAEGTQQQVKDAQAALAAAEKEIAEKGRTPDTFAAWYRATNALTEQSARAQHAKAQLKKVRQLQADTHSRWGKAKDGLDKTAAARSADNIQAVYDTEFATVLVDAVKDGVFTPDRRMSRAEREGHQKEYNDLRNMAIQADNILSGENTVRSEHNLFVTGDRIITRVDKLNEEIASTNIRDPRRTGLVALRNDLTGLYRSLRYRSAHFRLARAATRPLTDNGYLDFEGRYEVSPLQDGGMVIADGSNLVVYPDGSTAQVIGGSERHLQLGPRTTPHGKVIGRGTTVGYYT